MVKRTGVNINVPIIIIMLGTVHIDPQFLSTCDPHLPCSTNHLQLCLGGLLATGILCENLREFIPWLPNWFQCYTHTCNIEKLMRITLKTKGAIGG